MKQVIGIILAGGKSRRMGQDKSLMLFNGQSLLQNMISTLSQTTVSKVVINSNSAKNAQTEQEYLNCTYIEDIILDRGPLSGIHSALINYPDANLLIVQVDIPLMTPKSLELLILNAHSRKINCRFAPYSVEIREGEAKSSNLPLFIQNNKETLQMLEQTLNESQNYSVFNFCNHFPIYEVPIENDVELTNFNYPWQIEQ